MPNVINQLYIHTFVLGRMGMGRGLALLLAGSLLLVGCGGGEDPQSTDTEAPQEVDTAQVATGDTDTAQPSPAKQASAESTKPVEGLGIYQGAPVRKSPGGDAEYVTSLNVGESITFLGETREGTRGDQTKEYSKIRLKGGDEGWVRSDMIATDATPAAVLRKAFLHERPTPMASTDEAFKAMDVVAVLDSQETWVKVKGIRRNQRWWDTGWLRPDALTGKTMDVTVAALWQKANAESDSTKRRKALKRITTNPSFEGSVFLDSLTARLDTTGTS